MTDKEQEKRSTTDSRTPRFAPWALLPVALLAGSVTLVVTMVTISANDPGFAVEPDYYDKAIHWDAKRAQDATNAELGWQLSWAFQPPKLASRSAVVALQLADADGIPITGAVLTVKAFHNARAGNIQELSLREVSPGRYEAPFDLHRGGLWECRLTASHHGRTFTQTHQTELYPPSPSAGSAI